MQKDGEKCLCVVQAGERRIELEEMQRVVRRWTGGLNKPELFGSRWEKSKAQKASSGG